MQIPSKPWKVCDTALMGPLQDSDHMVQIPLLGRKLRTGTSKTKKIKIN